MKDKAPRQPRMAKPAAGWEITNHLCQNCYGRILERTKQVPDGFVKEVRCSNCGFSATGGHARICWCGYKMPGTGRNAGLRCAKNESPTPEMPGEIVVRCEDDVGLDKPARKSRGDDRDEFDDGES